MGLSVQVVARKVLALGELLNNSKFNLCNALTVALTGAAGTSEIEDHAVTSVKADLLGPWFEGTDTGTANAHAVAVQASVVTTLAAGQQVIYRAANTNTGAVTLNVTPGAGSALGAKTIKKQFDQDLAAGDVRAGEYVAVRYDGTNYQLLSTVGNAGLRYQLTTGTGSAYVLTFGSANGAPTVTALVNGLVIHAKAHADNTGACTLAVDGLTAKPIRKNNNQELGAGDWLTNMAADFIYDVTQNVFLMLSAPVINVPPAIVGQARGLIVKSDATNPTIKVNITADDLILKNGSNLSYLASAVSVSPNITASGVNGLDTGSEANIWYYLWVIYDGTTVAGLISASATAPTMPAGYTYKALVGCVRNSSATAEGAAAGDFVPFYQVDRKVFLADIEIFTNLFAGSTSVYQTVSGTGSITVNPNAVVPPIARVVRGNLGSNDNNSQINVAADNAGMGAVYSVGGNTGAFNSWCSASAYELPLKTAQDFYWRGSTGTVHNRLTINGYNL